MRLGECASRVVAPPRWSTDPRRTGSFLTFRDPARARLGRDSRCVDGGPVLLGRVPPRNLVDAPRDGGRPSPATANTPAQARARPGRPPWSRAGCLRRARPPNGSTTTGMDGDALDALRGAALRLDADPGLSVEFVLGCPDPRLCQRLEAQVGEARAETRGTVAGSVARMAARFPCEERNASRIGCASTGASTRSQTKRVFRLVADLLAPERLGARAQPDTP